MKTITLEDGRKVEISNESYENLAKSIRSEFKIGDWVIIGSDNDYSKNPPRSIGRISDLDFANCKVVVFNISESGGGNSHDLKNITYATPKKIEDHLIKEAEGRGFKEGVVKRAYFPGYDNDFYDGVKTFTMNDCRPQYEADKDALRMGGGIIYHQGKWAEIVKDEKIKLSKSYSAEILDNGDVKVGGQPFSFEIIEKVYKAAKEKYKS